MPPSDSRPSRAGAGASFRRWTGGPATLGLVTVFTLLAWIIAEAQTLQSDRVVLAVRFDASVAETAVRVSPDAPWPGVVEVEVRGPAGRLTELRRAAREAVVLSIGREIMLPSGAAGVAPGSAADGGLRSIDLEAALAAADVFGGGLRIIGASPASVTLEVRPTVSVDLPVAVDTGALVTRGPAESVMDSIRVIAPSSVAVLLPTSAIARLGPAESGGLEAGVEAEVPGVPVVLDGLAGLGNRAWGVSWSPERVPVRLTPRQRTLSVVLQGVPLRVLLDPVLAADYRVTVDDGDGATDSEAEQAGVRVRVAGPFSVVESLRAGTVRPPLAFVRVAAADIPSPAENSGPIELQRTPEVTGLPSGVAGEVVSPPVRVVLERRFSAEPPSGTTSDTSLPNTTTPDEITPDPRTGAAGDDAIGPAASAPPSVSQGRTGGSSPPATGGE